MKTVAVRLYGKEDLRLEAFELPPIQEDEILADIMSDSICMSSYKAAKQGADHKRVPANVAEDPVIIGHEFCGTILEVGLKHQERFKPGQKYSIQPALSIPGRELDAPGYSFRHIGGDATHIIIPREVMEMNCLLPYAGEGFFKASLSEPVSCIIGAFNTSYHFRQGEYIHRMGIVEGGKMAILGGAGPMGLGAIDYAIHGPRKPKLLVVTDIDQGRLDRAASIFTPEEARRCGVTLRYVNTAQESAMQDMVDLSEGKKYDDVFVFVPFAALMEQASRLLGFNGCLNFFAGPSNSDFWATINFYDVHYSGHHVVGSSGGNTDDMLEALELMAKGAINPAVMITHIGGLDCVSETVLALPKLPGAKKLIYTHLSMPLTSLEDFERLGKSDSLFAKLAEITAANNGLWSVEAEAYLLEHGKKLAVK